VRSIYAYAEGANRYANRDFYGIPQNTLSTELMESFPDPNSAEATRRLPGVSIQRDQREGRYVLIRGTEACVNRHVFCDFDFPDRRTGGISRYGFITLSRTSFEQLQ